MTDKTASDVEPTDLKSALIELRHAREEITRLRPFVDMVDQAQRAADAAAPSAPATRGALRDRIAEALAAVLPECDAIEADYRNQHDEVAVGTRAAIIRIRARVAVLEQQPAVLPTPADRAACPDPIECGHEAALGQAQQEIRRLGLMVDEYAAGARGLSEKLREERTRAEAMTRAMESTAADALAHRGCHRDLMGQCLRAEKAEAAVERVRSVLESEAVVGRSALDYRGLIISALMADQAPASDPSRMADEAQQPTPCSVPNVCEDGGDPCTTHEREQAHAEGDHGLCGADPCSGCRYVPCGNCPSAAASQPGKEA